MFENGTIQPCVLANPLDPAPAPAAAPDPDSGAPILRVPADSSELQLSLHQPTVVTDTMISSKG